MQPLQQYSIAQYDSKSGLKTNQKPFMIPDEAFARLENAYVWRDRVKKREGLEFLGRLRRILTLQALGSTNGSGNFNRNIISILTLEVTSSIQPGSISVTVGGQTFTEPATPDGTLSNGGSGTGTINYSTGQLTISTNPVLAATPVTISFNYFPGLPVMGIWQREIFTENNEQTIIFDTKYAYVFQGTGFQEFITGTVWHGDDFNFFWSTNYRGSDAFSRLFFVTNFVNDTPGPPIEDPIRYTDGTTWTDFKPAVDGTNFLIQARILLPYYGRLVALNVWEGTDYGTANSNNIYNRCRFSQIGSPIAVDAWRSDQFGKGGFIDAPTDEAIVSAIFFKNTLIVGFERSTWQLRYVGEYGLPFIWERISSDFGCESQFSAILFDQGVLQVGDRAIVSSNANTVDRIDLQIPDTVFSFRNNNNGKERVIGIRDFQRELVFWSYVDADLQENTSNYKYPNKSLLYNYRNNTYAEFRNNITFFGTFQLQSNVTWDSQDVTWDDDSVYWTDVDDDIEFPRIISGNQQGFIHYYGYTSIDEQSLYISSIDLTLTPVQITVPNHNLKTGEWIQINSTLFSPANTELNGLIYNVGVVDHNTLMLFTWDGSNFVSVSSVSLSTYIGNGVVTLFPMLNVETKDFNPYQKRGSQLKLSYVDFLMDAFPQSVITVNILVNSSPTVIGNLLVGNKNTSSDLRLSGTILNVTLSNPAVITSLNHGLRTGNTIYITDVIGTTEVNNTTFVVTYLTSSTFSIDVDSTLFTPYISSGNWQCNEDGFYVPGSEYAWFRFYATCTGQYLRLQMTYNNDLMSNIQTHKSNWILNAMALWMRQGSKNIF